MKLFPNSRFGRVAKWSFIGAAVGEGVALIGTYVLYRKMKNSRDFRYKLYNYDERIVDAYYKTNEKFGDSDMRKEDYKVWGIEKMNSYSYLK